MLRIRLRRVGGKKQPSYRIVVAESAAPRDGRFVEVIGYYNPRTEPETIQVKEDRALYWLSVGAQPSDSTLRLLTKVGTMERLARMKAGEPLAALVEEAETAEQDVTVKTKPALRDNKELETGPAEAVVAEAEGTEIVASDDEA